MAVGNDGTIAGPLDALPLDALPLDAAETQLLDVLRRTVPAAPEDDPAVLQAIRRDTVISLDTAPHHDALTPLFTEP